MSDYQDQELLLEIAMGHFILEVVVRVYIGHAVGVDAQLGGPPRLILDVGIASAVDLAPAALGEPYLPFIAE